MTVDLLIDTICHHLVDHPDEYRLAVTKGESCLVIEIFASAPEIGFLIGHRGRNINALRCLAQAAGVRQGVWVYVEVFEEWE